MTTAVIFDIDGTLVDSNDLHAAAWQETFRHFGKEVPIAELRQQIGKGADQYMPAFSTGEELRRMGDDMDEFSDALYEKKYMHQANPFPKAKQLLQRIRADDKRIALASSSKSAVLDFYMDLLGIRELVDVRTSANETAKSKPFPDIFAAALADLIDTTVDQAIVVGDAPYDADAAGKVGLPTIGLLCGGFPEQELRAAGAVAVYQSPSDLLDHYESSLISRA